MGSVNYATHEKVRDLAEKLWHEAQPQKMYPIIEAALEAAYVAGQVQFMNSLSRKYDE